MNILILNGSPRPNGNTSKMAEAFKSGAESAGHKVTHIKVANRKISGCLACEYCHTQNSGECIQKDDMQEIYGLLKDTELLVLASPIYYHSISGQLKCVIDRFYSVMIPNKPEKLKKVAMLLSSGDPDVYNAAEYSYERDFVGYLGLEGVGVFTSSGDVTEETLAKLSEAGRGL